MRTTVTPIAVPRGRDTRNRGPSHEPAPLREALDAIVLNSLRPISLGLAALFAVFAVSHPLALSPAIAPVMTAVALATAVLMLSLYALLRRLAVPARRAHALGAMVAALGLFNSVLHLHLASDPRQTTNVALIVIGVGSFFLSAAWLVGVLAVALASWGVVAAAAGLSPEWFHYGFVLLSACVLSALIHAVRLRTLAQLERMRLTDERRSAELEAAVEALRASEERERARLHGEVEAERTRLEAVLRQMPAGVMIVEAPSGKLLLSNRKMEELRHGPLPAPDRLDGRAPEASSSPDGRAFAPYESPLARSIATGDVVTDQEIEVTREDGTRSTFLASSAPIRDRGGRIVAGVLTVYDITERKRAERELRRSEERLTLALQAARMGTWQWNIGTGEVAWPDNLEALFGLVPGTFGGTFEAFLELVHAEDRELVTASVARAVAEGGQYEVEFRTVWPDGTLHWIQAIGRIFVGPTGRAERMLGLGLDITERKHGEQLRAELLHREQAARTEAEAARAQAEEASRLKDEFLATVSHELRTPLNAILGWARLLNGGRLDAEQTALGLVTIERNAHAQARLVEDLLDTSRIVSGKLHLRTQGVDLMWVIQAAVDAARPAAEAKSIELKAALDEHAGSVVGDPDRLQQVVWNLLANAVKFTPTGGRVEVRLGRAHAQAQITVWDTGQGIDAEFLPFVFDQFRQADGTAMRRHGGLGLGLAIVRHLVEAHGGTVEAESPGAGRGATFTVRLPLPGGDEGAERRRVSAAAAGAGLPAGGRGSCPPGLAGARVLVVDDEADARGLAALALGKCGAEVRTCGSAAEALEALAEWSPHVLVCDIGMPETDGYALLRRIRAREGERKVPAIALTAYARAEDRIAALAAGFQMHVAKPVDPVELRMVVAALAGAGRAR
jgi:PAS domain S-box-containing protein